MKYEEPELLVLGPATTGIQGGKGSSMYPDNHSYTTGAYPADE